MLMIFYVPNNDGIYLFVEQISVTKEILCSFKFTTNIDVAGRYGATVRFEFRKQQIKTVKMPNDGKKYNLFADL